MNIKLKLALLSFVFILSTVFFWLAINDYLYPSSAQDAANMQVVTHSQEIECNPNGECYLHILGSVDDSNGVAGVSGTVRYSENIKPLRIDRVGLCADTSYGFDEEFLYHDDPSKKIVTFSVAALADNDELKGGQGCIVTLVFTGGTLQSDPEEGRIALVNETPWVAGGIINGEISEFVVGVNQDPVTVKLSSEYPIPTTQPTPETTQVPENPKECQVNAGDCSCDSRIDLVDWEVIRKSMYQEGGSCDVNGDGQFTNDDVIIWKSNNELLQ